MTAKGFAFVDNDYTWVCLFVCLALFVTSCHTHSCCFQEPQPCKCPRLLMGKLRVPCGSNLDPLKLKSLLKFMQLDDTLPLSSANYTLFGYVKMRVKRIDKGSAKTRMLFVYMNVPAYYLVSLVLTEFSRKFELVARKDIIYDFGDDDEYQNILNIEIPESVIGFVVPQTVWFDPQVLRERVTGDPRLLNDISYFEKTILSGLNPVAANQFFLYRYRDLHGSGVASQNAGTSVMEEFIIFNKGYT